MAIRTEVYSYQEFHLNSSSYFNKCWYRPESSSLPIDTSFVYIEPVSIAAGFLYCAESAVGAILNFLVIIVLLKSKKLRKEYLSPSIINIALTDFLYSIFVLPVLSLRFYMKDQPLPSGCASYSFFAYGLWLCSAWNLLGIAILRCARIYYPSPGKREIFRRASLAMSLISWMISLISLLPTKMGKYGQFGFVCQTFGCQFIDVNEDGTKTGIDPQTTYGITVIVIGAGITVINIITYIKLRKTANEIYQGSKDTDENKAKEKRLKKEKFLGKVMGRITITFLLMYVLMITLRIAIPKGNPYAALVCYLTVNSIVVIDPIVHIISQQIYRQKIKSLFWGLI